MLPPPPVFRDGEPVLKKVETRSGHSTDTRPVPAPRPRKVSSVDSHGRLRW